MNLPPAIAEVVRLWLSRARSLHTRRAYLADAEAFVDFANLSDLSEARLADVVDWADSLEAAGAARATIARRVNAIRSLASFATASESIPKNFGLLAQPPTVRRFGEERILPFEYVAMMFREADTPRDRALLRTLYYGAMRNAEAAALRWRHLAVNPRGRGVLSLWGKGDRPRYVLMPAFVYGELVRLRGSSGADAPMWVGRYGKPLSTRSIHDVVSRIAHRARVPGAVSPHWLRHCHADHAKDARAPMTVIQSTLGHASLATTQLYFHNRPDDSSGLYLPVA